MDRAHLVGQSMGGWAVLGFALQHPERVRTLTLADSISGIFTPRIEQAFDELIQALKTTPSPDQLPIGRHFALGEQLARQSLAQAFLFEQIGSIAEPPPVNMLTLLRRTAYSPEDLKKLAVPTLFLVGSNDGISPPATIREAAAVLPGSHVVEIPDTGHSPYFEAPSQWNQVVLRFLMQTR